MKIAGRATGTKPGQRIVLFARAGTWYVQPFASKPFTEIQPDHSWSTVTHFGNEYAALLVERDYAPPRVADVLPAQGGQVIAVAKVNGVPSALSELLTPAKMDFSGFEWEVYRAPRDNFGLLYPNSPSNVWTDQKGWLHLRITKEPEGWTGAEIGLARSLGYGTYSFVIHELPELEPATVLSMISWDPLDAGQYHREFDILLGQRVQDILPLTEFFVARFAASLNKPIDLIPDEVIAVLKAHDWPGNIRELQNFIERAVLLSPGSVLRLPLDLKQTVKQSSEGAARTLADADREHILETLNRTDWLIGGQGGAAHRLGLPRTTLIYKMRKLGIEIRRSPRARLIRQVADEQCYAAANC